MNVTAFLNSFQGNYLILTVIKQNFDSEELITLSTLYNFCLGGHDPLLHLGMKLLSEMYWGQGRFDKYDRFCSY